MLKSHKEISETSIAANSKEKVFPMLLSPGLRDSATIRISHKMEVVELSTIMQQKCIYLSYKYNSF